MTTTTYHGIPYHLWNPATDMDEFFAFFGIGPGVIIRGEGPYVFNQRGTRYINGYSSVWNVAAGLGREELVEAACKQMRELAFGSCWHMVHPRAIELAAKLVSITNGHYQHVMLGTSGSEAVETALKMARQYHRQSPDTADRSRFKIISLRGSYHGFSYGVLSTSGYQSDVDKFGPLVPGFNQIEPPYCYRCPYGQEGYPSCGLLCARALEETVQKEGPETVAAFLLEPVMGDFGIVAPPEAYYTRIGEICRRNGVLLIADEVTTGFGRTGRLFATQDWDPQPDILCLGKAISNGYMPLSATLATDAIFQRFRGEGNYFAHGSTNSGHPVCCAVGLAAIDIIVNEKLPEQAAQVGAYLKSRLVALMDRHPVIGEVRGRGLMIGLELVKDRHTRKPLTQKETFDIVVDAAVLGLLVSMRTNDLRLLPPLIIDEALADQIVHIIDQALEKRFTAQIGKKARLVKELAVSKIKP